MAVGESIKFPDPSLGSVTAETQQPDFFQHLEMEPSVKQARNILGRYTKFPMSFLKLKYYGIKIPIPVLLTRLLYVRLLTD